MNPNPTHNDKEIEEMNQKTVSTAFEYLFHDLRLPEWQAMLIAGKIGVCSKDALQNAYEKGKLDKSGDERRRFYQMGYKDGKETSEETKLFYFQNGFREALEHIEREMPKKMKRRTRYDRPYVDTQTFNSCRAQVLALLAQLKKK